MKLSKLVLAFSLASAACYTLPSEPTQPREPNVQDPNQDPNNTNNMNPDPTDNPEPTDGRAPTVNVLEPADGAQVSGTVLIRVQASDETQLKKVQIYVGPTKVADLMTEPFEYEWDASAEAAGPVSIKAIAVDMAGNRATDEDTTVEIVATMPMPMGDPAADAKDFFVANVQPVIAMKCSADACHGGTGTSPIKFIPPNAADTYDVVTSYQDRLVGYFDKTTAPMLQKILAGHNGQEYGPMAQTKIENWLDMELAWRSANNMNPDPNPNPGGPTPGDISDQLINEWSGCMDQTQFTNENVADEFAYIDSSEGPCIRCHVNGQASFIALDDSTRVFNVLTQNKYFMLTYFVPNVLDPTNPRMEINTSAFQRVANGLYPHLQHPEFDENNDAMAALQRFYDETMARKTAGTCGPSRIVQ